MKKVTKVKKNWFKVQFEKHPYYISLVVWILSLALTYFFYKIIDIDFLENLFGWVFLLMPPIVLFLWLYKNKSKIKPFYKRNKKIFNRVYFYLGSVFSLIPIACIVGIIATGSVSNFIERAKFEINATIMTYDKYYLCTSPNLIAYTGYPKENRIFFLKEQTQYIDYFENKIEYLVLRDLDFLNFNHCTSTRYLLKAAQEGDEVAKEILVAYPPELRAMYSFPFDGENTKYIFSRYEKNIANMDLDNPAIAYSYSAYLDKNIYEYSFEDVGPIKPKALKYLKQSAEDGYFISMMTWLQIYSVENNFNQNNCDTYFKYMNILADNNSLLPYFGLMQGYMGKTSWTFNQTVFKCLDKKPNFSKAFSMLTSMPRGTSQLSKKTSNINSSYPAIFYLYGLGDVEQDYDKAYELFSYSEDKIDDEGIPDQAYIAYMNFKGMGVEQNQNKGKGLTIELIKSIFSKQDGLKNDKTGILLSCINFDNYESYKKKRMKAAKLDQEIYEKNVAEGKEIPTTNHKNFMKNIRNTLGQCFLNSEEVSIKFLEDYIFNRMSDFFKNPELVKTLNYLGEPK